MQSDFVRQSAKSIVYEVFAKKNDKFNNIKAGLAVNTLSYKTASLRKEDVKKEWIIIDAENETLGRLASKVAKLLRGKHKPSFTPHVDCGDNVIVINADKVRLTGNKWAQKEYVRHSGYPGGQTTLTAAQVFQKHPTRIVMMAVRGMLPKNRLGRAILTHLRVYTGSEHPHEAQEPKKIDLNSIK